MVFSRFSAVLFALVSLPGTALASVALFEAERPNFYMPAQPRPAPAARAKRSKEVHVEFVAKQRFARLGKSRVDVYDYVLRMGAVDKHKTVPARVVARWRGGKTVRIRTERLIGSQDGMFKGTLDRHAVALTGLSLRLKKRGKLSPWMVAYQRNLKAAGFGSYLSRPRALRALAKLMKVTATRLRDRCPGASVLLVPARGKVLTASATPTS